MNELTLKVSRHNLPNAVVAVDGKEVKFKNGKSGLYESTLVPEGDTCTVEVFTFSEYGGKLWWLFSLLFFVFSCFGIFDVPYGNCVRVRYKATLTLTENTEAEIRFNPKIEGKKAVALVTKAANEEVSNEYYFDDQLKKRRKIMKIVKALTWVAIIVGTLAGLIAGIVTGSIANLF